jgi:hypothetical protein
MAVNIRKFVVGVSGLEELVRLGSLTEQAARFLEASVAAGLNILVAGGTQAETIHDVDVSLAATDNVVRRRNSDTHLVATLAERMARLYTARPSRVVARRANRDQSVAYAEPCRLRIVS